MLDAAHYAALGLSSIHEKVLSGQRLSFDDGLALFNCPDIKIGRASCRERV